MKKAFAWLIVAQMCAVAFAYPKPYAVDASTPEQRQALTEKLWAHDESNDVRLWPIERLKPGAAETPYKFFSNELDQSNLTLGEVINPQFTFFRARGEGRRPAVVIYPGGGYVRLGWNKEGTEIAEWLNDLGFSAAVLLYRTDDREAALSDAQRTMGLLRRDAEKYGIDPQRLGVIGFSAGANLAVRLATNWRKRNYERVDDADDFSCRPDFMLPIYPWDLRPRKDPTSPRKGWHKTVEINSEVYPIDSETPPSFTAQAIDDFCEIETAVGLDYALRKAGVKSEIRIYPSGGHGYGKRRLGTPCDAWSSEASSWLAQFAQSPETVVKAEADTWNRDARRRFSEQRFGIFIHWGIYANYAQGEWYQHDVGLDTETYGRMVDGFYPSKFNAGEWVRLFKRAGAKYVTITARHHDGFSMWPTKVDDGYNIARTPFGRDVLGELAGACAEAGLQLNFYYSLMDWHRGDYPAGGVAKKVLGTQTGDYESYRRFMLGQIGELIDSYHPGVIWFDGEWEHARHCPDGSWRRTLDWKFDEIYDFIHAKKTLVANNNHQPIREKEDIQLFERDLPGDNSDAGFSVNQPVVNDRPIEQCDVIQKKVWGYRVAERNFLSAEDVVARIARAAARGSNLLMNIGPDGSGRLPARAVNTLEKVGEWFDENGESIYGTEAGGVGLDKRVVSTRKGNILYLHFIDPTIDSFTFKLSGTLTKATALTRGANAVFKHATEDKVTVRIVRAPNNQFDCVVKCEIAP